MNDEKKERLKSMPIEEIDLSIRTYKGTKDVALHV